MVDRDEERPKSEEMKRLEEMDAEELPKDLEEWPDGEAKYETFGGREGTHSYEEGPEKKLGPSELRHHEGGSVSISGEEVEDPEKYKGKPIPGGPSDPEVDRPSVPEGR